MVQKISELYGFTSPLIQSAMDRVDFTDTFATSNKHDSMELICNKIFNSPSWWVKSLFFIRNNLVKIVGLKNSVPSDYNTRYAVGGYVGYFKIYNLAENEVILGADDKHLNFRVSIFNDLESPYNIKVTTLVQFHNSLGRFYMRLIAPFHRIVVMSMVRNAYLKI